MKQKLIPAILMGAAMSVSLTCNAQRKIGTIIMISNRNIEAAQEYKLLSTYSGGSTKELRKSRAISIEQAVDQTVKRIAGGEYLMNVKIYVTKKKYYAVEGDVWGVDTNISYRGFKVGDLVTWKSMGKFVKGKIVGLKNDKTCLVENEAGKAIELKYDSITKTE